VTPLWPDAALARYEDYLSRSADVLRFQFEKVLVRPNLGEDAYGQVEIAALSGNAREIAGRGLSMPRAARTTGQFGIVQGRRLRYQLHAAVRQIARKIIHSTGCHG